MRTTSELDKLLSEAEQELVHMDARREEILQQIQRLKLERDSASQALAVQPLDTQIAAVTNESNPEDKIALFRRLFRGREDVYPKRFESTKTGKVGYQPVCQNEWIKPFCKKPKIRCGECARREFLPLIDEVIRNHLRGTDPVAIERSRSGNGAHLWIFFSSPVPAATARQMGSFILTQAMEKRPEIGLDSYDRLFPNQDTMPKGGFGSLIALPLQKRPRDNGNSLFVDEDFQPYPDQWAFLSSIRPMDRIEVESIAAEAVRRGRVIGVRMVATDDEEDEPWTAPPSRRWKDPPIPRPLPEQITLVVGNQVYIAKDELTPALRNRLVRLAAFQNPEFYKAQSMRLPIFQIPRVINCCEDFPKHIGIPRGCLDEVVEFLKSLGIEPVLVDERHSGEPIDLGFFGTLREDQQYAADAILAYDIGVLSAPTAFGKTVVAAYCIARRKVNTLVLVHRRQLLDQWISRLSALLGLNPGQIGQIGGGKRKITGIVDVGIIQSLFRKKEVDDLVGAYGYLIVDECHHISARSFEVVARQCKARFVTGLSATVTRKDGHDPIILMQCGPIRYHVDERRQAAERPFKHRVLVRRTEFMLPDIFRYRDDIAIHELYSALVSDKERNKMIIEDVLEAVGLGRSPVVLTERKEHLSIIEALLTPHVPNLIVLKGGMGRKQRKLMSESLSEIPENEPRVILATGRYLSHPSYTHSGIGWK